MHKTDTNTSTQRTYVARCAVMGGHDYPNRVLVTTYHRGRLEWWLQQFKSRHPYEVADAFAADSAVGNPAEKRAVPSPPLRSPLGTTSSPAPAAASDSHSRRFSTFISRRERTSFAPSPMMAVICPAPTTSYSVLFSVCLPVSIDVWPRSHLATPATQSEIQIVRRSRRVRVHLSPGQEILFNKALIHRGVGRGPTTTTFPFKPFPILDPSVAVISDDTLCQLCTSGSAPKSTKESGSAGPSSDGAASTDASNDALPDGADGGAGSKIYCVDCFEAVG
jgi:hypothetical protein